MSDIPEVPTAQELIETQIGSMRLIHGRKSREQKVLEQRRNLERRRKAFELWLSGASFDKIGEALGVSGKTAFYDIVREKGDRTKTMHDTIEGHRVKQYFRYERLILALWPKCMQGDVKAHERAGQHMHAQANLYGMYAPLKVAATTPDGKDWAPLFVAALAKVSPEDLAALDRLAGVRLLPEGTESVEGEVVGGQGR